MVLKQNLIFKEIKPWIIQIIYTEVNKIKLPIYTKYNFKFILSIIV